MVGRAAITHIPQKKWKVIVTSNFLVCFLSSFDSWSDGGGGEDT